MKKFNIILLILWLFVIFMFSQDSAVSSSEKSKSIATTIINLISDITGHDCTGSEFDKMLNTCIIVVRKSAHFLEYMILGILMINVIKDYKKLTIKSIMLEIFICFIYACSDEIHQLFITGRSGRILDVFIDTSGSIFGIFIYYTFKYRLIDKKIHKEI